MVQEQRGGVGPDCWLHSVLVCHVQLHVGACLLYGCSSTRSAPLPSLLTPRPLLRAQVFLRHRDSALFNLSLLTSDIWGLAAGVILFGQHLGFLCV